MIYKNYARFIRFLNEYRNRYQNVMVALSLPTVALFVGSTDRPR